jgi:hypothetical protein
MKVVDGFIPKSYQDAIHDTLISDYFPWHIKTNISGVEPFASSEYAKSQVGFYHSTLFENDVSDWHNLFVPLIYNIREFFEIKINRIVRSRVGLFTKTNDPKPHFPHVDFDYPHKTLLYYVNDSDGDTVFYKNDRIDDLIESDRVTPKSGRAVLFDGNVYHSSTAPVHTNYRIALNINFV